MAKRIPDKLKYFLKNGLEDFDDGYEYASELSRILNSDDCQQNLTSKEIESIRDFADDIKKIGEFNYYSKDRVKEIETDRFGKSGIIGFLGGTLEDNSKPVWPF
ncbi:UNVERIFIED_CONTAM: hypothetical protein Cloal_1820 [Acetivibrio alkalicellulosi]